MFKPILFFSAVLLLQACTAEQIKRSDEVIYRAVDSISRTDKVTGTRELNLKTEKQEKNKADEAISYLAHQAKQQNTKIFQPSDALYQRVFRIYSRILAVSHYREAQNLKLLILGVPDFNAIALGGGNVVVYEGLARLLSDDELAYVIGHEIAHNAAGHISESEAYRYAKDISSKHSEGFNIAFTNINEQEADLIGILYSALAGFDPYASATIWEKMEKLSPSEYSYFLTHPANPERASSNRETARKVISYYSEGKQNRKFAEVLNCNVLFCSSQASLAPGEGGGLAALAFTLANAYKKNKQTEAEFEKQKARIALVPPKVTWQGSGWITRKGSIKRHGFETGVNFGFNNGQGKFFYNHNGEVVEGLLSYKSTNEYGYWWNWSDKFGTGLVVFKDYTDGSIRGTAYLADGTNPGKALGAWNGQ